MVQCLPPSSSLYSLLPWDLTSRITALLPAVAMGHDPVLVRIHHSECEGDLSVRKGLDTGRVYHLVNLLQLVLNVVSASEWTQALQDQSRHLMQSCRSDAERLLLLDWAARFQRGPALYVDDARFTTSSPAAVVTTTTTCNHYARGRGVVFLTTDTTKSSVFTAAGDQVRMDLSTALGSTIQGGTPNLTSSGVFLGAKENAHTCPALTTLRQIEQRGGAFGKRLLGIAQRAPSA